MFVALVFVVCVSVMVECCLFCLFQLVFVVCGLWFVACCALLVARCLRCVVCCFFWFLHDVRCLAFVFLLIVVRCLLRFFVGC